MAKIQVLPHNVADQIAAGEVAERPAAVVKELVENAMDAGAHRIGVEIQNGGITSIRVTDDGSGIPADQIETAFLRHATSKLSVIEDLESIATMGFRGEALASICAVAEVEVITKTRDAAEGCCLSVIHGKAEDKQPIACADGTTMLVKKLFANVPARMKFLKRDATEAGYVADVVSRMALSRPDIAFSYIQDGKEVFATVGDDNLQNAVLKIYGLDHARAVLAVDHTEDGIKVKGLIGKPELARGNRTRQTLFVNGRYVKNHIVSKVAEEAFRNRMMVGRFPFFVLSVELSPAMVDVNVHPAKTEVKFANEKQLYDVVYHAIRGVLENDGRETVRTHDPATVIHEIDIASREPAPRTEGKAPAAYHGGAWSTPQNRRVTPTQVEQFLENTIPKAQKAETGTYLYTAEREEKASVLREPKPDEVPAQLTFADTSAADAAPGEETKIIGQVFDTYVICQKGDRMLLIDQHAAHERLRFERLRTAYLKRERMAQMLMSPMVLHLEYSEKQTVTEHLSEYQSFGFEMEDFGGRSVIIHGAPIAVDEATLRDLVLELCDAFAQQRRHPVADFEERALDMISCKYAIKANHHLSLPEMQELVLQTERMEKEGIGTCPHGRPVCVTLTKAELEKMFGRRV